MNETTPFSPQDNLAFCMAALFMAFIGALALTERVRRYFVDRAIYDIPNHRSSHKTPIPRGGGWAIIAMLIPATIFTIGLVDHDFRHAGLAASLIMLAAVSGYNDQRHLSPIVRLAVHLLTAYLGSLSFRPEQTLFNGALPFWADRAILIVGWAWFMNLYNFMDGIDGITSVETVSLSMGFCLVCTAAGLHAPYSSFLSTILIGVSLGFLAHNWHPARIFLGDVGSIPLGYLTGYLVLLLAVRGYPVPALILPLYYLVDSGYTIARRALQGKTIWEAHREHMYQYAALGAKRHDKVVLRIAAANIGLICAAVLSVTMPWLGLPIAILIVARLLVHMRRMKRIST
jgi:UDP-N-acetylmuramyl pentapeptide phosphotransferase/UDP-N-acetylglucosamine-1-phosphate transferase